jgi:hypothetical protein
VKPGDLVEFTGRYYYRRHDARWEWIINSLTKLGIITHIAQAGEVFILCNAKQYLVAQHDIDEGVSQLTIVNNT